MSFNTKHRQETVIYLVLWALLLLAPVITLSIRLVNTDDTFRWDEVFWVWKEYLPFFIIFLIHNHLLAPMLIYQHKRSVYFTVFLVLVVLFQVYQCNHRPDLRKNGERRMEMRMEGHRPPEPPDNRMGEFRGGPEGPDGPEGREGGPHDRFDGRFDGQKDKHLPPVILGQHDVISIVILILMMGMNLGIKLYFRQREDQKRMGELEKQNLEQQLEYLKYQINPHFFMNTLNNIHALVDIDPEMAKQTILELSKMMRFVLYEGNKAGVPLDRDISFLQNYITLMKLRYTDKVRINVTTPENLPNKEVPPLLFITFVENAFKHGVSYRQESYIDIGIDVSDGRLQFTCTNSRIPKEDDKHGGVGLRNVKQRLDLIYGENYTLDIEDNPDMYKVNLTIPL